MAWTKHGHQIPGTARLDPRTRPTNVARCGGIGICSECSQDLLSSIPKENPEESEYMGTFENYQHGLLGAQALGHAAHEKETWSQRNATVSFQDRARLRVFEYVKPKLDKSDAEHETFSIEQVFVVWFSKVLQNWKALVSTTLPDGMYYEITYNGEKHETYIDAYKKFDNVRIPD